MNKLIRTWAIGLAVGLVGLAPAVAQAHGFGERYDLPIPLGLYIAGAGATVLLSFVIIGIFARGAGRESYPRYNLLRLGIGRALAYPVVLSVIKALSVAVFILYLATALLGTDDPNDNLAPTVAWILFWVGLAYFSALVGNVWALINPWKILFGWAEQLWSRLSRGEELSRRQPYPEGLGAWPAVVLFFAFAWVENVYPDSAVPFNLGVLTLLYTAITFAGMFWYGRDVWLKHGEIFSIAFGFLAMLSPTEVRVKQPRAVGSTGPALRAAGRVVGGQVVAFENPRRTAEDEDLVDDYEAYSAAPPEAREWNLRPWGAGLMTRRTPTTSQTAFLVLMLATVTFDGFSETPLWSRILTAGYNAISGIVGFREAFTVVKTVGLLAFPLLFWAVFAGTAALMGRVGRSQQTVTELMSKFVFSLVPIALAYHIAHYFSFLGIQGQRIVSLASDPFGWGWDLFGTAGHMVDITAVDARMAWFVAVVAIVVGHIVAVYAAHIYALRQFTPSTAVRSQYPMMALMVFYTMVSLWIIAQPVVEVG